MMAVRESRVKYIALETITPLRLFGRRPPVRGKKKATTTIGFRRWDSRDAFGNVRRLVTVYQLPAASSPTTASWHTLISRAPRRKGRQHRK